MKSASTLWLDVVALALPALRARPLRTAFSVIGIAIGMLSFVVIVGASSGGRARVVDELRNFGLNSIWIRWSEKSFGSMDPRNRMPPAIDTLDYLAIRDTSCCSAIQAISPILDSSVAQITAGSRTTQLHPLGVGIAYQELVNDELAEGRRLIQSDENEGRRVALLAPEARAALFGRRLSILGESIMLDSVSFEIVGVLKERRLDFLNSIGIGKGQRLNERVIVPFRALQALDRRGDAIDMLHMSSRRPELNGTAIEEVTRILQINHRHAYQYNDNSARSDFESADRILDNVALAGLVASALSLLVGGIGIANVMGVAVIERTREIGLRKAIGATDADIVVQFALEAMLVGLFGGFAGLCGAYGSIAIARLFTTLPLYPNIQIALTGLAVATSVGFVSGLAPAMRAAALNPTDALRS